MNDRRSPARRRRSAPQRRGSRRGPRRRHEGRARRARRSPSTCRPPAYPRHEATVVEADHQLGMHRNVPAHAFDDADDIGRLSADRHEVDQADRTGVDFELRLQHEGRIAIAPSDRADRARGRDRPAPVVAVARAAPRSKRSNRSAGSRPNRWIRSGPRGRLSGYRRSARSLRSAGSSQKSATDQGNDQPLARRSARSHFGTSCDLQGRVRFAIGTGVWMNFGRSSAPTSAYFTRKLCLQPSATRINQVFPASCIAFPAGTSLAGRQAGEDPRGQVPSTVG